MIFRGLFYFLGLIFSLATFYSVNPMDLIEQTTFGFNLFKIAIVKLYNRFLDLIKFEDAPKSPIYSNDDLPEPKMLSLHQQDEDYDRFFKSLEKKIDDFEKKITIGDGLGHEWNLDSLRIDSYLKYFVVFCILFTGTFVIYIYGDSVKEISYNVLSYTYAGISALIVFILNLFKKGGGKGKGRARFEDLDSDLEDQQRRFIDLLKDVHVDDPNLPNMIANVEKQSFTNEKFKYLSNAEIAKMFRDSKTIADKDLTYSLDSDYDSDSDSVGSDVTVRDNRSGSSKTAFDDLPVQNNPFDDIGL
jgi:hypothetical protein